MSKPRTTSFQEFSEAEGLNDDVELALEIQSDLGMAGEPQSRVQSLGNETWLVQGDRMDLFLASKKALEGFFKYLETHSDGFYDLEARAGYERAMSRDD